MFKRLLTCINKGIKQRPLRSVCRFVSRLRGRLGCCASTMAPSKLHVCLADGCRYNGLKFRHRPDCLIKRIEVATDGICAYYTEREEEKGIAYYNLAGPPRWQEESCLRSFPVDGKPLVVAEKKD